MKAFIFLVFLVIPNSAWADFDLQQIQGNWSGEGRYVDDQIGGAMRCRLRVYGHSDEVILDNQCRAAAGAADSTLRLTRDDGGGFRITVERAASYAGDGVSVFTGVPENGQLVLRGSAGEASATLVLRQDGDQQFHLAGEHIADGVRQAFTIDFLAQ